MNSLLVITFCMAVAFTNFASGSKEISIKLNHIYRQCQSAFNSQRIDYCYFDHCEIIKQRKIGIYLIFSFSHSSRFSG